MSQSLRFRLCCGFAFLILTVISLLLPMPAAAKKKAKRKPHTISKAVAQKAAKKKAADVAREHRLKQAFVASSDLKPMAKQLFETHSKAAYGAVEKYAKKHADSEAGALAWLVLGYARSQENNNAKSIEALRNAKPLARELGDYVDLLLAQRYSATQDPKDVLLVLSGFDKQYPSSIFVRDAALTYANALMSTNAFEQAAEVLEEHRKPIRADIELTLGRAYLRAGDKNKALEIFRRLYYAMPLSGEADEAGNQLRQLAAPGSYGTVEERKTRADLLARSKHYWQAAAEYRQLRADAPAQLLPEIQVSEGYSLYKSDKMNDANQVLASMTGASGEEDAQRLYILCEMSRSSGDDIAHAAYLEELRKKHPESPWFEESLYSAGNKALLKYDLQQAADRFDEISSGETSHQFSRYKYASSAHWKAAWLYYRMGKFDEAKKRFEEQINSFPHSPEIPAALYWRGRLAENDHSDTQARAYYLKLSSRFRNYYYSMLARERLAGIKATAPPPEIAELNKIPELKEQVDLRESTEGITDVRLQKARLLTNGAMFDFAIKELQAAVAEGDNRWVAGEIARTQEDAGRPYSALETMKRAVPSYFALDTESIPRSFLQFLFPRPFWQPLKSDAAANGLDPYLVASLIRQESEFNCGAISSANAYGLMQLLPSVGKNLAKQLKLKPFSTSRLLEPEANLRLGTRYFHDLVDQNGGQVEYALAAYNAGENRVSEWRAKGGFHDVAEFVESIPFTETRDYVQAIMRNRMVYKKIYGSD